MLSKLNLLNFAKNKIRTPIKLIFGNKENFLEIHKLYLDEKQIANFIIDDIET